jgi:hypothetical protein
MPWYELETRIKLMRFTMPRLFNIAHFQNQRKTVVLCMNALQTRAGGRQVNGWKGFGPLWTLADVSPNFRLTHKPDKWNLPDSPEVPFRETARFIKLAHSRYAALPYIFGPLWYDLFWDPCGLNAFRFSR